MHTVADQFANILAAAGIKRFHGIVGDSLNGITDAIGKQGEIDWIHAQALRGKEYVEWANPYDVGTTGLIGFSSGYFAMRELEQKTTAFPDFGTGLRNPDFAAMAGAIGIRGIRIEDPAEADAGIAAAFAHDGPLLVDAVVNRTELAMLPTITLEMAKGFSLFTVEAVMNGRTDEIIDLQTSNLWH